MLSAYLDDSNDYVMIYSSL